MTILKPLILIAKLSARKVAPICMFVNSDWMGEGESNVLLCRFEVSCLSVSLNCFHIIVTIYTYFI